MIRPQEIGLTFNPVPALEPMDDIAGRIFLPDTLKLFWTQPRSLPNVPYRFRNWELLGALIVDGARTDERVTSGPLVSRYQEMPALVRDLVEKVRIDGVSMFGKLLLPE
jgi:hypothetical protein